MNRIFLLLVLACLLFPGCAKKVNKDWTATGGSRTNAVVELSFTHTGYEIPVTNEQAGLKLAEERCKSWGYAGAQAFGGAIQHCNGPIDPWSGLCSQYMVTKQYQCLGQGTEVNHSQEIKK